MSKHDYSGLVAWVSEQHRRSRVPLPPTLDREEIEQHAWVIALASGAPPSYALARIVHRAVGRWVKHEWRWCRRRAGDAGATRAVSLCGAQVRAELLDTIRVRLVRTPRLLQVFEMALEGRGAGDIADALGLSRRTVSQDYFWKIREAIRDVQTE